MSKKNLTGYVNVNLKLNLNDIDERISSIAKLIKDGDYVDDKKIIKLKGKDLVMYLLAARVSEKLNTSNDIEKEIEPEIINNKNKMKNFGIKTNL
jgi:hypothetical protein